MYQTLQGISNFAMIWGATLVALSLIALPFERNYKRKNGAVPKRTLRIFYVGVAVASLIITLPLHFFVFKPRWPYVPNVDLSKVRQEQEARKEDAIRKAVGEMNERLDRDLGIRRVELTPEQLAQKAQEEAEQERRRQEAKEQHEAKAREIQDRHAAIRRKMEEMREMRQSDFFRPPEGSTTPEQKALDAQIVALNEELQELKAESQRLEGIRDAAGEAMRALTKARPIDQSRIREEQTKLIESQRAASDIGRAINKKRSEVTSALEKWYSLSD